MIARDQKDQEQRFGIRYKAKRDDGGNSAGSDFLNFFRATAHNRLEIFYNLKTGII